MVTMGNSEVKVDFGIGGPSREAHVTVTDNRSTNSVAKGDIITIESSANTISINLDTGFTLRISRRKLEEYLMLDRLKESK